MTTKLFLLLTASCLILFSQPPPSSTRQVVLTWDDTLNPAGTTYNIYRSPAPCGLSSTVFTKLIPNITAKTYTDTATPGQYCYYATATTNALESDHSNTVDTSVNPYPPSKLSVTVQLTVTVQ